MRSLMPVLMLTALTMSGCAPVVTPDPKPSRQTVDPIPAKEALKGGCNRIESTSAWTCSHAAIAAAVHGLTDAAFDLEAVRTQLAAERALGGVDRAELAGQLWVQTQDTARAVMWGWVKGAIGIVLGALATGLVVVLSR